MPSPYDTKYMEYEKRKVNALEKIAVLLEKIDEKLDTQTTVLLNNYESK